MCESLYMNVCMGIFLMLLSDVVVYFQLNSGEIFGFYRSLFWWFCITGWLVFLSGTYGWWLLLGELGVWRTVVIYSVLTLLVDILMSSIFFGFESKYVLSLFLCFVAGLVSEWG